MISRNDPCFCGSGKKWKKCHYPEKPRLSFDERAHKYLSQFDIVLKSPEQLAGIKHACEVTSSILKAVCEKAQVGVTTNELDSFVMELHKKHNATPAPLNYGDPPYPKAICTSLNDVICHGIPDDVPLKDGDILNIDVSSIVDGYFGDCSAMVCVGEVDAEKRKLVEVTKECLMKGIEVCKPGVNIYEIANAIEGHARKHGYSVVNQFVGHGVGLHFHEAPQVPHHYNRVTIPMEEGMTFTIEPMINSGKAEGYIEEDNGWIARTVDGGMSAQWEHTIHISADGVEILTPFPD